jgi:intein/homing endonuclease
LKKNIQAIILSKQSKNLVFTLEEIGLKAGNKSKNRTSIPNWILKDKQYSIACIRGLIDTDGSVYPKTKKT